MQQNGRKTYSAPQVKRWGTVADLTHVGLTNPGFDVFPGEKNPNEYGSITHSNAGGQGNNQGQGNNR